MKCPHCHHDVPDGTAYCPRCQQATGIRTAPDTAPKSSPATDSRPVRLPETCSGLRAIGMCFVKCTDFSGRASRSEYWWPFGAALIAWLPNAILRVCENNHLYLPNVLPNVLVGPALFLLLLAMMYFYASLLALLACGVRPLHDSGKSGWFLLLNFIPVLGTVTVLMMLLPSQPGANRYGGQPNPFRCADDGQEP